MICIKKTHAQLLDVLISAYAEPQLYEFSQKLVDSHRDSEDLTTMFTPVLDHLWKLSQNFGLLHPDVFPLLNTLILFSRNLPLASCLVKSKLWLPSPAQHGGQLRDLVGSSFEYETILGRFLGITSIPQQGTQSEHEMLFKNFSKNCEDRFLYFYS